MIENQFIIDNFKEGDKIEVVWNDIVKQGTFHHLDNKEIWIKQYGKKKKCWVIDLNDNIIVNKINKFTIKKR